MRALWLAILLAHSAPSIAGQCELKGKPVDCNFGFERTGAYANSWVAPILPADGKFHKYDENPVPYLARKFISPTYDTPWEP